MRLTLLINNNEAYDLSQQDQLSICKVDWTNTNCDIFVFNQLNPYKHFMD